MKRSTSDLVFPGPDGNMMRRDTKLEAVLRRALGRAGIVIGYEHVCRKKGCKHAERAAHAGIRRCPEHKMKLWPKAQVRPIRFHSLRHTTATLLIEARASLPAVQQILRHRDPRMTIEVYTHLMPGHLKDQIDRLSFEIEPRNGRRATLLHDRDAQTGEGPDDDEEPNAINDVSGVG